MVCPVDEILRGGTMPEPHQAEHDEKAEVRGGVFSLEPFALGRRNHEPHIDVIAEPGREAHVPAIPEIPNVLGEKGAIEILGAVDAEQVAKGERKLGVSREIKKEIKTIGIHVHKDRAHVRSFGHGVQPIGLDQRRQDELVKKAGKEAMDGAVEVLQKLGAGAGVFPVFGKAAKAIDGTGRDRRKEKDKAEILQRRQGRNQPILDAKDDVEAAKSYV